MLCSTTDLVALSGLLLVSLAPLTSLIISGQSTSSSVPPEWQTHAEKTNYRETPRYRETVEYCHKLAAAAPSLIRFTQFGWSGEGRALPLVIAARDGTQTPQAAQRAGSVVVLVQACIHAGESDGKDAGLALLRDIAITKTRLPLLNRAVILFIPIYNADGHERFGPYNRINQNGPREMGWRATATNLNLNRDYMKADAPETRAWLKLWSEWRPDLFIDCHVTDGADYRYNVTYGFEHGENIAKPIRDWALDSFDKRIVPATEAAGNLLSRYFEFRDNRDFSKGIETFIATPRFSTGYTALRNRPGLLIETHMLKDYRTRVQGTYDLLRFTLEEINRDPESLRQAVLLADEQIASEGLTYDASRRVALRMAVTDQAVPFQLKGVEYRRELSEVSGAVRVRFGTKPVDQTIPFYNEARAHATVAPPLYYIVPPQWTHVIEVLAAHGLALKRLAAPLTVDVESYRFSEVKWAAAPFEGRIMLTYKIEAIREKRTFPAGSTIVPMAQTAARVALHLLEPEAPDSLVAWGFFNSIFEQKEFGEAYVVEQLARDMLAKDEALRGEFEERLMKDPKFSSSPRDRLQFFYERSLYRDPHLNSYPVARVTAPLQIKLADF